MGSKDREEPECEYCKSAFTATPACSNESANPDRGSARDRGPGEGTKARGPRLTRARRFRVLESQNPVNRLRSAKEPAHEQESMMIGPGIGHEEQKKRHVVANFETDDVHLASFLYCRNFPIVQFRRLKNGKVAFSFHDSPELRTGVVDYANDGVVPARTYCSTLRDLQAIRFS